MSTTDNKGAMTGEHCINCGLKVDPKCACSRGRALLVAQPAQAVGKQPVAYLVTDPADDQISHIVRPQELANNLKADGYIIEALVIGPVPAEGAIFQRRVQPWLMECFGSMIAGDREERNHRFLEEALELVQACGCSANEAHQLVNYVFGRPVGEAHQEVGGVMVTLAALCLANGLDMHRDGETELARISVPETVAKIRAKQAAKPKYSPLPAAPEPIHASDAVKALFRPWPADEMGPSDDPASQYVFGYNTAIEEALEVLAAHPAPAVGAVPVHAVTSTLRDDEIEEFKAAIEDFEDNGETAVDYVLLMDWARRGLLECVHFEVTKAGRDALDAAKSTPDAAKGEAS